MAEVRQEAIVEQHCKCNVCGDEWIVAKELVWQWDLMCHHSVSIMQVRGQLLFSDAGGAWVRRAEARFTW